MYIASIALTSLNTRLSINRADDIHIRDIAIIIATLQSEPNFEYVEFVRIAENAGNVGNNANGRNEEIFDADRSWVVASVFGEYWMTLGMRCLTSNREITSTLPSF